MKGLGVALAVVTFLYGPSVLEDAVPFVESVRAGTSEGASGGAPSGSGQRAQDPPVPFPSDWNRATFQTGRKLYPSRLAVEIRSYFYSDFVDQHKAAIVRAAARRFSLSPEEQRELLNDLGAPLVEVLAFEPRAPQEEGPPTFPLHWSRGLFQTGTKFYPWSLATDIKQHFGDSAATENSVSIVQAAADRFSLSPEEQRELLAELGASPTVVHSFEPRLPPAPLRRSLWRGTRTGSTTGQSSEPSVQPSPLRRSIRSVRSLFRPK